MSVTLEDAKLLRCVLPVGMNRTTSESSQKPFLSIEIIQASPVQHFKIFHRQSPCNLKDRVSSLQARCFFDLLLLQDS